MATPNIVPRSDSEGGLGTASKYWASAYIDNVFVSKIGRDAHNLIDFSTDNQVTFRCENNNKFFLNGSRVAPSSNDGLALGAPTGGWSDFFLAEGAVINFNNGNVTLTHSSGQMDFAGGNLVLADNSPLFIGSGGDGKLESSSDDFIISQTNADKDIIFKADDGSGGTTAYITLDGSSTMTLNHVHTMHLDNKRAYFGTGFDLEIYHDTSNSYISQLGTGNLIIQNTVDNADIVFKCDDGSGGNTPYITLDGSLTATKFSQNAFFIDNATAYFGDSLDLQIFHDSNNSNIQQAGTGNLVIRNITDDTDIIFQNDDGAGGFTTYFYLDGSSATHDGSATTNLFTNWPDKSTISLGTSHDFKIQHNGTNTELTNSEGNLIFIQHKDDGDIVFQCDDGSGGITEYFKLDGTNVRTLFKQSLNLEDNVQLQIGNSQDLKIYHNTSHSFIEQQGTGNLHIRNIVDDGDVVFQSDDGSGGVANYLTIDGSATITQVHKNLRFDDGVQLQLGTGSDLRIYHDGTDSYINNATGNLQIKNSADDKDIEFVCDDGSGGNATYFRLDGSQKDVDFSVPVSFGASGGGAGHDVTFFGATSGRDMFWDTSQDALRFDDNAYIYVGSGNDLQIYHNAADSILLNGTGDLYIANAADDRDIVFQSDNGSGGITTYIQLDGSEVSTKILTQKVIMTNLPTSDPGNSGQLWNDNGTLKISVG